MELSPHEPTTSPAWPTTSVESEAPCAASPHRLKPARRATPHLSALLWLTAILAAGCGGGAGKVAFTTRDSAGVAIAVSERPAWRPGQAWRVEAKPLVDIGGGSDPHQQLFGVIDAARLADGRIVVANAGTHQIRIYDAAGHWVRSMGRKGKGPGEFTFLNGIRVSGDSILASDGSASRVEVFDTTGTLRGDIRLADVARAGYRIDGVTRRGLLMIGAGSYAGRSKPGLYWDSVPNLLVDTTGAVLDTVGRFAGQQIFLAMHGPMMSIGPAPFGHRTSAAVWRSRLYEGSGDRWRFSVYGDDGRLQLIVRWSHPTGPVTDAALDSLRSYIVAATPAPQRAAARRLWADAPHGDRRPAYTRLVVDSAGDVWLRDFRAMPPADRWHVFAPDGRLLGAVTLPRPLRVTRVGSDWLLGVWRDGNGVEHVQLLSVVKR